MTERICGNCANAGEPWKRRIVGGTDLITLHWCPKLKDNVNTKYGGCWDFIPKKKKAKKPLLKKREYFASVAEMRGKGNVKDN